MKILITMAGMAEWDKTLTEAHVEQISNVAPEVSVEVAIDQASPEQAASADVCAGFPVRIPKVTEDMKVQWIHAFSAGVDYVLTDEVKARDDIVVTNSSGVHAIPITEHVIGMITAYNKNFPQLFAQQAKKEWDEVIPTWELFGKKVLIFGLGSIGSQLAQTLSDGYQCAVSGVVRTKRDVPTYVEQLYTTEEVLSELADYDYIISCLPGSHETAGMFNADFFKAMWPSAVFVNIGRGSLVNQDDLVEALQNEEIRGALLDVTKPEPLPHDSPLWELENLMITPHSSALSGRSMDRIVDRFCLNLEAFLRGESLPNEVNKELGY